MTLTLRTIISIALLLGLVACDPRNEKSSSTVYNGVQQYFYPDGKLYLEISLKDSVPHGPTKVYYKTGQVQNESYYVNGIRHGFERTYYEDGRLSSVTPYDSGRIHGVKRKYRRDGITAYEAPYHLDQPCAGLKEFYLSGQPVNNYPDIVVRGRDELRKAGKFTVEVSLSNSAKSVEFYRGKLAEGKYIGKDAVPLHVQEGVGHIYYYGAPGGFITERIHIIAKMKTDLGNFFITQKAFNVEIGSR